MKDLLTHLASQFATIVRGEIALVVHNLGEKISDMRNGLILIAAALFIGFAAFISLCAAVVIALFEVMSPAGATCTVGGVLLGISLLLAFFGYTRIISSVQ